MKRALAALALVPAAAAAQTYNVIQASGQNVTPPPVTQAGTPLRLGDDNSVAVNLGFAFPYYGQTFTQAYISSNGFINFTQNFNGCCGGQPMANAPRDGIYPYWTDLISGTSPYVQTLTMQDGTKVFSARWQTNEYGTNNVENFGIQLAQDGRIAVTYGATANTYHTIAAGITGPTSSDNIQFYYGSGPTPPSYTAYGLTPVQPKPKVDCNVTPNDPSCPPSAVAPVQTPAPVVVTPTQATQTVSAPTVVSAPTQTAQVVSTPVVTQTVANTQAATATATPAITAAPAVATTVATVDTTTTVTTTQATASVTTQKAAERLSPDQLKALIAGGAPISIPGAPAPQGGSSGQSGGYSGQMGSMSGPTQSSGPSASFSASTAAQSFGTSATFSVSNTGGFNDLAIVAQATASANASTPTASAQSAAQTGAAQTFSAMPDPVLRDPTSIAALAFNSSTDASMQQAQPSAFSSQQTAITALSLMPVAKPAQSDPQPNQMSPEQEKSFSALTSVPQGFNSYQAKQLADNAFYPPREVYKRQKTVDAYMTLYRLLQSGDRRWEAMTESQYGK